MKNGTRLIAEATLCETYLPILVYGNCRIFSRLIQLWFVAKHLLRNEVRFGRRKRVVVSTRSILTQQVLPSFGEATWEEVREHTLYCPKHQDVSDRRQWDEKDDDHRYKCDRILERPTLIIEKKQIKLMARCSTKCSFPNGGNELQLTARFAPLSASACTPARPGGSSSCRTINHPKIVSFPWRKTWSHSSSWPKYLWSRSVLPPCQTSIPSRNSRYPTVS